MFKLSANAATAQTWQDAYSIVIMKETTTMQLPAANAIVVSQPQLMVFPYPSLGIKV
jgi:hypothetical protein